jgi:hypothetical protein
VGDQERVRQEEGKRGVGETRCVQAVFSSLPLPLPPQTFLVKSEADATVRSRRAQKYAQALHSHKFDQFPSPFEIDSSFLPAPSRQIIDFQCGGSFTLVLDGALLSFISLHPPRRPRGTSTAAEEEKDRLNDEPAGAIGSAQRSRRAVRTPDRPVKGVETYKASSHPFLIEGDRPSR